MKGIFVVHSRLKNFSRTLQVVLRHIKDPTQRMRRRHNSARGINARSWTVYSIILLKHFKMTVSIRADLNNMCPLSHNIPRIWYATIKAFRQADILCPGLLLWKVWTGSSGSLGQFYFTFCNDSVPHVYCWLIHLFWLLFTSSPRSSIQMSLELCCGSTSSNAKSLASNWQCFQLLSQHSWRLHFLVQKLKKTILPHICRMSPCIHLRRGEKDGGYSSSSVL